jgi:IS30 family transposase
MWDRENITAHAGHSFPHEGSCSIAKSGSTSSAAIAASGATSTLKREVRRGGFGKFTYHASPTQARSRHEFRIALIRYKRA